MTRPASHTSDRPRRCCDCKHMFITPLQEDMLCCYGDDVIAMQHGTTGLLYADEINGVDMDDADGDGYDRTWPGRRVDDTDTCDEWEQR